MGAPNFENSKSSALLNTECKTHFFFAPNMKKVVLGGPNSRIPVSCGRVFRNSDLFILVPPIGGTGGTPKSGRFRSSAPKLLLPLGAYGVELLDFSCSSVCLLSVVVVTLIELSQNETAKSAS